MESSRKARTCLPSDGTLQGERSGGVPEAVQQREAALVLFWLGPLGRADPDEKNHTRLMSSPVENVLV